MSSKISSLGGRIVTEVGDGIMLNSHNRTQQNFSSFLPATFINLGNIFSKYESKTKCTMVLQVKKDLMHLIYRDVGTIKRQGGGGTRTKGTSIDLQLCVDLPMKA
jgi:hypothetical protein